MRNWWLRHSPLHLLNTPHTHFLLSTRVPDWFCPKCSPVRKSPHKDGAAKRRRAITDEVEAGGSARAKEARSGRASKRGKAVSEVHSVYQAFLHFTTQIHGRTHRMTPRLLPRPNKSRKTRTMRWVRKTRPPRMRTARLPPSKILSKKLPKLQMRWRRKTKATRMKRTKMTTFSCPRKVIYGVTHWLYTLALGRIPGRVSRSLWFSAGS